MQLIKHCIKVLFFTLGLIFPISNIAFAQWATNQEKLEIQLDSLNVLITSDAVKAQSTIDLLKNASNTCLQYNGFYYEAFALYNKGEYQNAKNKLLPVLDFLKKNKTLFTEECYLKLIFKTVNRLFFIEKNLGNYNKALEILQVNESYLELDVLPFLYGTAHLGLGNYEEAIRLFKKDIYDGYLAKRAKKTTVEKKYSRVMAQRLNALGDAYQKLYKKSKLESTLDSANYYFSKAAEVLKNDDKMPDFTAALLIMRRAKSYAMKGDYAQALDLYRTRTQYPIIKDKVVVNQFLDLRMADCFIKLGQSDSAVFYANCFLNGYEKMPTTKENLSIAYFILSECYGKLKENQKAYFYAQKNITLTKEMETNNKEALDFIHNYDIKSIKEQYQKVVYAKNKRVQLYLVIGLVAFLLLLAYVLYSKHKSRLQNKRYLDIIAALQKKDAELQTDTSSYKPIMTPVDLHDELVEGKSSKPIIDEEASLRIADGLRKLEKQKAYLKADFKLAYVAKKLNTNTVYLSSYFNQNCKQSFSDYVQALRMEFVLTELKNNPQFRNYTLQAIAEEIGYKNANTFVSVFKKVTGISPNFYIQKLQQDSL